MKKDIKEIIKKIENDDPEILGELAEIILIFRDKPKLNTIQVTGEDIKTMNKAIREKVKK